jgi:hypothetical protein
MNKDAPDPALVRGIAPQQISLLGTPECSPIKKFTAAGCIFSKQDLGCPRSWRALEACSEKLDPTLRNAYGPFDTLERARNALQKAERFAFGIRLGPFHILHTYFAQ